MNPMVIIVVLVVALFGWILARTIRRGEFRTGHSVVRRSDQPGVFWFFVALQAGVVMYIASLALEL